ncbi:hypothetical protein AMTRI_Chr02g223300 [Amborella trichopoda]|uniref:uncharacterized protein LOC18430253 n=1 Tax=Amborella trichopoda TaxID=13333 RepID=UPI0005D37AC8|nr:uncharacterized protein LOC18430253 [Amborella trichopoda]|eukprot:XP_011621901.1 uncharacterized protein LOC18430253 [Amborella trichopoda]
MDPGRGAGNCYYRVLGIPKGASVAEIRGAYRKLAMKWHPDKWAKSPSHAGEANRRFQEIQEAYTVLSDEVKRAMYDVGVYDPLEEEDEGFSDFMQELMSMMDGVTSQKNESFEELQRMFMDMVGSEGEVTKCSSASKGRHSDRGKRSGVW